MNELTKSTFLKNIQKTTPYSLENPRHSCMARPHAWWTRTSVQQRNKYKLPQWIFSITMVWQCSVTPVDALAQRISLIYVYIYVYIYLKQYPCSDTIQSHFVSPGHHIHHQIEQLPFDHNIDPLEPGNCPVGMLPMPCSRSHMREMGLQGAAQKEISLWQWQNETVFLILEKSVMISKPWKKHIN